MNEPGKENEFDEDQHIEIKEQDVSSSNDSNPDNSTYSDCSTQISTCTRTTRSSMDDNSDEINMIIYSPATSQCNTMELHRSRTFISIPEALNNFAESAPFYKSVHPIEPPLKRCQSDTMIYYRTCKENVELVEKTIVPDFNKKIEELSCMFAKLYISRLSRVLQKSHNIAEKEIFHWKDALQQKQHKENIQLKVLSNEITEKFTEFCKKFTSLKRLSDFYNDERVPEKKLKNHL